MKNPKLIIVALLLAGTVYSVNAKTTKVEKSTTSFVITKIHPKKVYAFKGKKYHFRTGNWYVKRGRKFIQVRPPAGIQVRHLPRGSKIVKVNGKKLYKYNGIWYKKNRRGFIVVKL